MAFAACLLLVLICIAGLVWSGDRFGDFDD